MKRSIIIFLTLLVAFSCEDFDDPIGAVRNESWFKELQTPCEKDDICKTYIMRATYLGNTTVYYSFLGGGYCDIFFQEVRLYDENGEVVKEYNEETDWKEFNAEVTDFKVVWSCYRHLFGLDIRV